MKEAWHDFCWLVLVSIRSLFTLWSHQDIILDADLWKTCSLCKSPGICTIRFAEFCTSGYLRSINIQKYLLIQIFRILYLQISEDIYWHISMQHRYPEICIYINLQKFLSAGIQKYLKIYIDIYFWISIQHRYPEIYINNFDYVINIDVYLILIKWSITRFLLLVYYLP